MRVNFAGMKSKTTHLVLASMIVWALALSVRAGENDKEKQRTEIRKMATTLFNSFTKPSQRPKQQSRTRRGTQSSATWG